MNGSVYMLASNSKKGSKTQDGVVGLDVQAAGRDRIIAAACNRTRRSACTQICRAAVTSHPASRFSRCTLITPTRERERERKRDERRAARESPFIRPRIRECNWQCLVYLQSTTYVKVSTHVYAYYKRTMQIRESLLSLRVSTTTLNR